MSSPGGGWSEEQWLEMKLAKDSRWDPEDEEIYKRR